MSNPIDINLRGEQFNVNLAFIWKAEFNDGSALFQFDHETGIENKFKLVQDKFSELKCFYLYHYKDNINFCVDLIQGKIFYNCNPALDELDNDKNNVRLIFFRRHQIKMSMNGKEKSHTIIYFLGIQWQSQEGKNKNIILQINENGDFIIDGK